MRKYKIYSIDYLMHEELNEDDLHYLLDTPSLNYSLIIEMFRLAGYNIPEANIINICRSTNDWQYKYFWAYKMCVKFEEMLTKVFHNVYYYGPEQSIVKAQWWITMYGLTNDKLKDSDKKYTLYD